MTSPRMTSLSGEWRLNPAWPLARRLVLFLGGRRAGTAYCDDASGRGNHGAFIGDSPAAKCSYDARMRRNVMVFDGSDDYVTAPIPAQGLTRATLGMWFRLATKASDQVLGGLQVATGARYAFGFAYYALYGLRGFCRTAAGQEQVVFAPANFSVDVWYFASMTWDGSDLLMRINGGDTTATREFDTSGAVYAAEAFRLGRDITDIRPFNGALAGVMMFSDVLQLSDIQQLAKPTNIDMRVNGVPGIIPATSRPHVAARLFHSAWARHCNKLIGV